MPGGISEPAIGVRRLAADAVLLEPIDLDPARPAGVQVPRLPAITLTDIGAATLAAVVGALGRSRR